MPLPANPYRPSPEGDKAALVEWTERTLSTPQALSDSGRRYLVALSGMTAREQIRFLVTMLIISGVSLPPFPDQR